MEAAELPQPDQKEIAKARRPKKPRRPLHVVQNDSTESPPDKLDESQFKDALQHEAATEEERLRFEMVHQQDEILEEVARHRMDKPECWFFRDREGRRFCISRGEDGRVGQISFRDPEAQDTDTGAINRFERYIRTVKLTDTKPVSIWKRIDWMVETAHGGEVVDQWDDSPQAVDDAKKIELQKMIQDAHFDGSRP